MSFRSRLKEARKNRKMTQTQLGDAIGVAKSTIASYELGNSHPDVSKIQEIISVLGIDANYLWQDEMSEQQVSFRATLGEQEHIEKYRLLDPHGRKMVDFTINEETSRMEQEASNKKQRVIQLFGEAPSPADNEEEYEDMPIATYEAAGGVPRYIGEEDFEMLRVPSRSVPYGADFGVRIKGDSMEPDIPDGCIVWVRPQDDIENGEIGIFIVEEFSEAEATCKQAKKDNMGRLVALDSLNPGWKPLTGEVVRNARCIGKVVGTYCEE